MEDEQALSALIAEFRDLPELSRGVASLRVAVRMAARAGDGLAGECYDEDPVRMLSNLRDAFMSRLAFPERGARPPSA